MQFLKNTNINFASKTLITTICSTIIILIGIVSLIYNGGPALSIDFTGGNIAQLKLEKTLDISNIRTSLINTGLDGAEIIEFGSSKEILIKTQYEGTGKELINLLQKGIDVPFTIERFEKIGPKIGDELRSDAINAIIAALLLISIYISFRFDRFYAYGSLAALTHDILITLGIFSILNIDIDLTIIAAFLTIVGYSLNDTIVVFDRIRETQIKFPKKDFNWIVNTSLNSSLSRTIITSLTTLLVVVILFISGGAVIKNFAFALIVGVLVGTYSSIFIASPVMKYFEIKNDVKQKEELTE
tara:strand:- start:2199 stop:3098 length:900 start_codon:yes stop_codon:yes gene_type:complete